MLNTLHVSPASRRGFGTIGAALQMTHGRRGPVRVVVDPGTYTESLLIRGEVELVAAAGPGTVQVATAGAVFTADCAGTVSLDGLTLVTRGGTAAVCTSGSLSMARCRVVGQDGVAVDARPGTSLDLQGCEVHAGRVVVNGAFGTIGGCTFTDAIDNAIAVIDGANVQVSGCTITNPSLHGIRVSGATGQIANCRLTGTGRDAIAVDKHATASIVDCEVVDVHTIGIGVAEQSTGTISATTITGAADGIVVTSGASPTVTDCTMTDCRDAGVIVRDRGLGRFARCSITGAGNVGFFVTDNGAPTVEDLRIGAGNVGVALLGGRGRFTGVEVRDQTIALRLKARSTARFEQVEIERCDVGFEAEEDETTGELREVRIAGARIGGVSVGGGARVTVEHGTVVDPAQLGMAAGGNGRLTVTDCEVTGGVALLGNATFLATRLTLHDGGLTGTESARIDCTDCTFPEVDLADTCIERFVNCTISEPSSPSPTPAPGRPDDPLTELDRLIGLAPVKKQVRTQVNMIKLSQQRQAAGLPMPPLSRHLVFSGPPGTGKTTVARLYGQILESLGVLTTGKVREVARSHLVGQFLGSTAQKTREVFDSAKGGVLFIDEAYTLARKFGVNSDFGQEAIDELVKLMEDHREEVVVIAAGYTDEMETFLDANPGLRSRFSRVIEFPAYSTEELVQIIEVTAAKDHYRLDADVPALLHAHLADRETCNARDARSLFESMVEKQAERLAESDAPSVEELTLLLAADIPQPGDA